MGSSVWNTRVIYFFHLARQRVVENSWVGNRAEAYLSGARLHCSKANQN
jgi:hypothetical protein